MRIAHFVHRYPPALGGAEAYFARLSEFLVTQNDDVKVFTTNALDLTAFWSPLGKCLNAGETNINGVHVRRYRLWRMFGRRWLLKPLSLWPNRWWQGLTLPCNPIAPRMWHDANNECEPFDIVHASALPYAFPMLCGLRLARRLQIPFMVTPFVHWGDRDNPDDATRRAYTSPALVWLLKQADTILVQTTGEQQVLLDAGIPVGKLVCQGLGVEPRECTGGNRERVRQCWGIRHDEAVIGHLANNSEEKGTVDLLRAALQLWKEGRSFRVVLAGPEMPNFQRFWRTFSHCDRVIRLGRLTNDEKRDFFVGLDVFALPSRSDSFGLVLLEAWANGVPNIAYRAGGPADVIRHQEDGLLVQCGEVPALAGSLRRLLEDPTLRRMLGRAGQRRIDVDYRWRDKLQLVRSMYLRSVSNERRELGTDTRRHAGFHSA